MQRGCYVLWNSGVLFQSSPFWCEWFPISLCCCSKVKYHEILLWISYYSTSTSMLIISSHSLWDVLERYRNAAVFNMDEANMILANCRPMTTTWWSNRNKNVLILRRKITLLICDFTQRKSQECLRIRVKIALSWT